MNTVVTAGLVMVFLAGLGLTLASSDLDHLYVGGCPTKQEISLDHNSRPFYMGFSTFPSDSTTKGTEATHQFIDKHADVVLNHFDHGPPWLESLHADPYPQSLMSKWNDVLFRKSPQQKLYIALTMTDGERVLPDLSLSSMTPEQQQEWRSRLFNHPDMKTAYLNYAKRTIDYLDPDYLAIAIEINQMLNVDRERWESYQELHKFVYTELKKEYPTLTIFATYEVPEFLGYDGANATLHHEEVMELVDYSDLIGFSAYPHGWPYPYGRLHPVPDEFFDVMNSFGISVAVTETGAPSKNFQAFGIFFRFREGYQTDFIKLLLEKATEHEFEFVINWVAIDFDKMNYKWSAMVRNLGKVWAYTGLQRSDRCDKEALHYWDAYLSLEKK